MTDDRNATPGAAPPPLAPPPIPAQPPYAPAAPIPAARAYARQTPWGWIVAALLAAVLITLVCLYFFTDLLSREPRYSGTTAIRPSVSRGPGRKVRSARPPPRRDPTSRHRCRRLRRAPARFPAMRRRSAGSRGHGVPLVRVRARRSSPSTTAAGSRPMGARGHGRWPANNVTLIVNGRTLVTRWEYLAPNMARVTQAAGGRAETVQRCP